MNISIKKVYSGLSIGIMLFFGVTVGKAFSMQDTLYNGIVLPDVWPPQMVDPERHDPIRIPYLENPPEVISAKKGRQLFVDDFLIEETTLKRIFHLPEKMDGNPVLFPQTDEEINAHDVYKSVTYLGHGGVFYDGISGVYKMYYTAGWRGGLALAESRDLFQWKRVLVDGSNIIIPKGQLFAGGDNAVWLDQMADSPDERYKMLVERRVDGEWKKNFKDIKDVPTHTLHVSPDGINWSLGLNTDFASDYTSFFYNPFRGVWVFSIKRNTNRGRARFYYESKDFLQGRKWGDSKFWVNADNLDKPDPEIGDDPQLYSLNAVAYESILLGQFYIHLGPHNDIAEKSKIPKITEIKLGFSRDGFHWDRPDRRAFIKAERKKEAWDRAYLHGTMGIMLIHNDELWFPYTGYSGLDSLGNQGMYTGAGIGMAKLRRDGFASMDSEGTLGTLKTKPFRFDGKFLFINANCSKGALQVEILDEKGNIIPGYSKEQCKVIDSDDTIHMVEWSGGNEFDLKERDTIRLKFYLENGSLYSFWVTPDREGASFGYLGAGGSDYPSLIDDMGLRVRPTEEGGSR